MDRVKPRREVASDHVDEPYGNASIRALPFSQEIWRLVIAKGLAKGLPAIVPFWVDVVADLVVAGNPSLFFRDNSPEETARAITALTSDPARVRYMGNNGRNIIVAGKWGLSGALAGLDEVLTHFWIDS